jgi:uncharacterized protein
MRIRISWHGGETISALADTPTARKLLDAFPCESSANAWGEEVYFGVPVRADLDPDAKQVVPPGSICFWVGGQSLAIPFGRTPASRGNECRLVTAVNVLGKLEGDPRVLDSVNAGDAIRVEVVKE